MKTLIHKIILIVLCVFLLVVSDYMFLKQYIQKQLNLTTTYIAKYDIEPRHLITSDDLLEIQIPNAYIENNAYTSANDIIGKYTSIQGMIPAGSMFYISMLFEQEELPDHAELELLQGQVIYALETNMSDSGDMTSGQRVDVYVTIEQDDGIVMTGCLLEHVRIVSIKDHTGLEISDVNSTKIPYMISLAINQEDIELIAMAEKTGKIRLFASSMMYDTSLECLRKEDSNVTQYLQQRIDESELQEPDPE